MRVYEPIIDGQHLSLAWRHVTSKVQVLLERREVNIRERSYASRPVVAPSHVYHTLYDTALSHSDKGFSV